MSKVDAPSEVQQAPSKRPWVPPFKDKAFARAAAKRSSEVRTTIATAAHDPDALERMSMADLVSIRHDVVDLLRNTDLNVRDRLELLKLKASVAQQALDRTRGKPRQADSETSDPLAAARALEASIKALDAQARE